MCPQNILPSTTHYRLIIPVLLLTKCEVGSLHFFQNKSAVFLFYELSIHFNLNTSTALHRFLIHCNVRHILNLIYFLHSLEVFANSNMLVFFLILHGCIFRLTLLHLLEGSSRRGLKRSSCQGIGKRQLQQ